MDSSATIIESQVDWLTLTHPSYAPDATFNLWGKAILRHEEQTDNRRVPWKRLGYEGEHCGKASWGSGPQGSIIMLSGQAAQDRLDTALDVARNVSRLDLAVTVKVDPPDEGIELRQYQEFRQWHADRHSRMKGSLISGVDGSATLYVGSRVSELFMRVYNKEVESRNPRTQEPEARYVNCHRWELEVKGLRPRRLAETVSTSRDPAQYIRALIASHLEMHGIDDRVISESRTKLLPGFRRRSDTDSKLEWLGSQVRSTCDWLKDHGHQAKVLHALGYDLDECVKVLKLEEVQQSTRGGQ